jgi:tetratricopeptide (TPR) repeat protein
MFQAVRQYDDARRCYERALNQQPNDADLHNNLGVVLRELGQADAAVGHFRRAIQLNPAFVDAQMNLGRMWLALRCEQEASEVFETAVRLDPSLAAAHIELGRALATLGRCSDGLASCERALRISPNNANALILHARILHLLARYSEALTASGRALDRDPNNTDAIITRVTVLLELDQTDDAIAGADRCIALDPNKAEAYRCRARALQILGRHIEAIADYKKAIELAPGSDLAKWNASASFLCLGRFAEGWKHYEFQWSPDLAIAPLRGYSQPRWSGQYVPGTLLIWGGQGLGDQILYGSTIPELNRYAERVIIEVEPRLVPLFARSFPYADIAPLRSTLNTEHIDAHEALSNVPMHLRRSWDEFPVRDRGYLEPNSVRVRALRERLSIDQRPIIGLNWISRSDKIGRHKSAQLKDFETLLRMPEYRFIDLQYGDTSTERESVERELGVKIEHLDDIDNTNDIDGLAALIAACDAVLSVSNTTAHLAGALGVSTLVMVPFGQGHLWYWFLDRPTSPWYSSVQVRFQHRGQSWAELIEASLPALACLASPR